MNDINEETFVRYYTVSYYTNEIPTILFEYIHSILPFVSDPPTFSALPSLNEKGNKDCAVLLPAMSKMGKFYLHNIYSEEIFKALCASRSNYNAFNHFSESVKEESNYIHFELLCIGITLNESNPEFDKPIDKFISILLNKLEIMKEYSNDKKKLDLLKKLRIRKFNESQSEFMFYRIKRLTRENNITSVKLYEYKKKE